MTSYIGERVQLALASLGHLSAIVEAPLTSSGFGATSTSTTSTSASSTSMVASPSMVGVKRSRMDQLIDKHLGNSAADGIESSADADGKTFARCRPWSRSDLHERARTFKTSTWFAKPPQISPLQCARFGWINTGHDRLTCTWCSTGLLMPTSAVSFGSSFSASGSSTSMPRSTAAGAGAGSTSSALVVARGWPGRSTGALAASSLTASAASSDEMTAGETSVGEPADLLQRYQSRLKSGHRQDCPWNELSCPAEFATLAVPAASAGGSSSSASSTTAASRQFAQRLLSQARKLEQAIASVASSASAVGGGAGSGAGAAVAEESPSSSATAGLALDPAAVPSIMSTLASYGPLSQLLLQLDAHSDSKHGAAASPSSQSSVTALSIFTMLVRRLLAGVEDTGASGVGEQQIAAMLRDPQLLPYLLPLFGWSLSSNAHASSSAGDPVAGAAGVGAKRPRSLSASQAEAAAPSSTSNSGAATATAASCLHCEYCDASVAISSLFAHVPAKQASAGAGSASAALSSSSSSSLLSPSSASSSALLSGSQLLNGRASGAAGAGSSSGAGVAATTGGGGGLLAVARATMQAASRAMAAFTQSQSNSQQPAAQQQQQQPSAGASHADTNATTAAAVSTGTGTASAGPAFNPLRHHTPYCPFITRANPLPRDLIHSLLQRMDAALAGGSAAAATPAQPMETGAAASSSASSGSSSSSSNVKSALTSSVAAGLASLSAASVGAADVDAVSRLLIGAVRREKEEARQRSKGVQLLTMGSDGSEGSGAPAASLQQVPGDHHLQHVGAVLVPGWLLTSLALFASMP